MAAASTFARSIKSPSGMMPFRPALISTRIRFGAALAIATTPSIPSLPAEPASTSDVTPSARHNAPSSFSRPAWVWMSISPGTTSFPAASIVSAAVDAAMFGCTAAILPPAMATSAVLSKGRDGTITRPPLISRSYCAPRNSGSFARVAALAAATERNVRRVTMRRIIASKQRARRDQIRCSAGSRRDDAFAATNNGLRYKLSRAGSLGAFVVDELEGAVLNVHDRDVGSRTRRQRAETLKRGHRLRRVCRGAGDDALERHAEQQPFREHGADV